MEWSPQQREIFDWFANADGNLTVRARAGTGKTTTIIEGISHAPEDRILLAAFNKKIAVELQERLKNPRAQAKTLHSLGFGFVMQNWRGVKLDARNRGKGLICQAIQNHFEREYEKEPPKMGDPSPEQMVETVPFQFINMGAKLLGVAREVTPFANDAADIATLAWDFDCVPDKRWSTMGYTVPVLAKFVLEAMTLALEPTDKIDFSDMLYLPVR